MKRLFVWSALVLALAFVRSAVMRPRVRRVSIAVSPIGAPMSEAAAGSDPPGPGETTQELRPGSGVSNPHPGPLPPGEGITLVAFEDPDIGDVAARRGRRGSWGRAFGLGAAGGLVVGVAAMGLFMASGLYDRPGQVTAAVRAPAPEAVRFEPEPLFALEAIDVTIAPLEGTAVLGSIDEGEQVEVFVVDGDWAAVRFPSGSTSWGWAPAAALAKASEMSTGGAPASVLAKSSAVLETKVSSEVGTPRRAQGGSDDVLWMAMVVALGMTLAPAGLAWAMERR